MTQDELAGPILAKVSRSFYLSVRVLPAPLRSPVGLAYLLARASDTIADAAHNSREVRLRYLSTFLDKVDRSEPGGLDELVRDIQPDDASERRLIASLPECMLWLTRLEPKDRKEVQQVIRTIVRGQALDLERFPDCSSAAVVALQSAAELEEYTYLVAGCVGEFWTRICQLHLPRYSDVPLDRLENTGRRFGQGLQLVNILRDLPADLRSGRCYLPAEDLKAGGLEPSDLLANPDAARPLFLRWVEVASGFLDSGREYVASIRNPRVRLACFLPWCLGVQTLHRLRETPSLGSAAKIKVPRSTVYRALGYGLLVAFSDHALSLLHPPARREDRTR